MLQFPPQPARRDELIAVIEHIAKTVNFIGGFYASRNKCI